MAWRGAQLITGHEADDPVAIRGDGLYTARHQGMFAVAAFYSGLLPTRDRGARSRARS